MHRRWLAGLVAFALGAAGCSSSSDDGPETRTASDLTEEFGQDTVDAAIDVLAASGIEVRVRPDDDAIENVDDESPLRLLRFQARNLALEANKGGGTLGADLDAFTEAAGGVPVSFLIAGWARNASTPGAQIAADLLDITDRPYPPNLIIPSYVVALFLGDVTAGTSGDAPAAGFFGQGRRAGQRPAADTGLGGVQADTDDFCAQVSSYLSASLADVLDPDLSLEPQWLEGAIDFYGAMENDPQRIRTSVGAMSLLVYATSISRPWVPLLVPRPFEFHHTVGDPIGESTELRLSVETGEEAIAQEAAECASLAGVTLPEQDVEGTSILWVDTALLSHVNRAETGGDLELDENGVATYEYEPITESADEHKNGTRNTAVLPVSAIIKREEIEDVKDAVESLLTGGDLGVASPEVVAAYARMSPMLERLLYPRASTAVTVTWHTPKPPDEEDLGQCAGGGCAASNGDPHLVPVEGGSYDFQAGGEFTLLRLADASLEIQARQEPVSGSTTVAATTAVAATVGEHRLAIYRVESGVEVRVDGESVALTEELDLGDGASAVPYAEGVAVTFPDGTVMWVVVPGSPRLDLVISPSDEVRESGQGLLGVSSSDGYGLPLLADGSFVPEPDTDDEVFDLLYGEYAESWRVTDTTSLFDYGDGESPETFLVPDFPSRPLRYEDLTPDQLALGEEACADVESPVLHRQCVFDVGVTGDATYAEVYLTVDEVVLDAAAGLGEPGQLLVAPSLPEPEPTTDTGVTVTIEEEPVSTTGEAAEPRDGEPAVTLSGDLVASYSEHAYDDGVVVSLAATVRAEEGTVLLLRTDGCPADATVFVSVTNVESGVSTPPFLCDPMQIAGMTSDEDDEVLNGETYVWLPAAGVYEVNVDTDSEEVTPMTIELFTDPTPTIVSQAEVTDEGHAATLSGIGDTIVYALDGSASEMVELAATGLHEACVVEAWAAEPVGTPEPWSLGYCAHADTAGSGIPGGGIQVPVVVFARTDDDIDISVTPGP